MLICLTGTKQSEALLPDQKPDTTKHYRPSIYNQIRAVGNRTYLYNTLSRRLALLQGREEALLRQVQTPGEDPDAAPLIAKRFLVPEGTDETAHYVQLFSTLEIFASATDRGYTMYDILPTTGCNARCFYCFEQGVQVKHMTEETADAVVDFIQKTHYPGQKIQLSWFGGEPLLRPGIIDRICAAVQRLGIDYYSTMITNGSLFTPQLIQKAKNDWRLDKVQITLDGVGAEHERRKNYVNLPNAYERTLENITGLVNAGIGVTVRMNMDPGNADDVSRLYDLLKTRYRPTDRIVFDPALLSEDWFSWSAARTPQQQAQLREKWLQLRQRMIRDGYMRHKPLLQNLPRWHCMANSPESVTILPDGTLSMCQTGCEEMYYGDVRRGITKPELVQKWRCCTDIREKCRTCPYLPECTGFALCPSPVSDCRTAMADTVALRLTKTIEKYENL